VLTNGIGEVTHPPILHVHVLPFHTFDQLTSSIDRLAHLRLWQVRVQDEQGFIAIHLFPPHGRRSGSWTAVRTRVETIHRAHLAFTQNTLDRVCGVGDGGCDYREFVAVEARQHVVDAVGFPAATTDTHPHACKIGSKMVHNRFYTMMPRGPTAAFDTQATALT